METTQAEIEVAKSRLSKTGIQARSLGGIRLENYQHNVALYEGLTYVPGDGAAGKYIPNEGWSTRMLVAKSPLSNAWWLVSNRAGDQYIVLQEVGYYKSALFGADYKRADTLNVIRPVLLPAHVLALI